MTGKLSDFFARIMLGIFIGLLSLGVLLGTFGKLESPSYIFALFLAAGFLLLWCWFYPRYEARLCLCWHPGPVLTGLLLALFCFGLNLIWVLNFQIEPTVDFYTFYETACQLAAG